MSKITCSIASFTLMIIFCGCKKEEPRLTTESFSANKKESNIDLKQVAKKCKVASISGFFNYGRTDTVSFEYNQWGDPVSVTRTKPGTDAQNVFFTYDNRHRLTEVFTGQMLYEKCFYSGPGGKQAIMDSTYLGPIFHNGVLTSDHGSWATWIFYDSQGRVIKDSVVGYGGLWTALRRYSYDANGNKVGSFNYDNKVNLHVTSEIFQFVDRDYSVNNPFVAEAYNSQGLPTILNTPSGSSQYLLFLGTGIGKGTIVYDCK